MNVRVKAFLPGFEEAVMLARLRFDGRRLPGAIRAERAWRARQSNTVPPMGFEPMLERV